jgi:hypothetical protein
MIWGDKLQTDTTSDGKLELEGICFHALPEQFIPLSGPMEHNCWGRWALLLRKGPRNVELAPLEQFSYTYK